MPHPWTMALKLLYLLALLSPTLPALPSNALGPDKLDARIGIVGAGPAGLHMAYLLRQLGFSNLLILEAAGRVGGRSVTVPDDSVPGLAHEMGTCYVQGDYVDLRRMARAIGYPLDEVTLPEAVLHHSTPFSDRPVPLRNFVLNRVRRLDPGVEPDASDEAVMLRIGEAHGRYLALRRQFFPPGQPDYLEFPMTPPPPEDMARLNCTVLQFLEANSLMALEPYFLLGMTSMGYGHVGDTAALYGLMWMSPAYMSDLLGPRADSQLAMLRRGFQPFWEAARDHLTAAAGGGGGGVQLRLGSRVSGVSRSQRKVLLRLEDGSSESLDWLVWTAGVHGAAAGAFEDLSKAEESAFASLATRRFRTRLVRLPGEHPTAEHPVAYFLPVLESHRPSLNRLLAVRNSAKVLLPPPISPQQAASPSAKSTLVAYYLSDYGEDVDKDDGAAEAVDGDRLGAGEVLAEATFDYMPRFSVTAMADGALWRVLHRLQGARRTWFAGHSVVFDSVKSVMKYNKMLLLAAFPDQEERLAEI